MLNEIRMNLRTTFGLADRRVLCLSLKALQYAEEGIG